MDRLTKDSLAASKAGMSYGKWKALHPHTEHEEQDEGNVRRCVVCGKRLHGHQRFYCSHDCSKKQVSMKKREKRAEEYVAREPVIKHCQVCGAEFEYPARRKYCSEKCANEAILNRAREYSQEQYAQRKEERRAMENGKV